jgi:pantothenate synthetase
MNATTPRDRNAALMISLTLGLVQAAFQQMGKVRNEVTGKVETQLDAARVTIDTLAALEERTRGARSEEETQVMERALSELRMNYVDEVKKAAAAATGATATSTASSEGGRGDATAPGDAQSTTRDAPEPASPSEGGA